MPVGQLEVKQLYIRMKKQIIFIMAFFACAINALAENLSIADVSLTQGEATSVNINLTNSATNIVGFQFDLTLPEAVAPVTSSTGAVNVTATSRLGGSFTLRGKSQGNNTYRFVYLSTSGTGISGISGSIFSINLSISGTASCGIVEGAISNVTITGKDGSEISPEGSSFNITLPHTATAVAAKTATCTEDGNKAYWYCSACNKYFTTSACTIETTIEAMTIPALNHEYGDVVWTWNGLTSASAKIVCTHDATHVISESATITSEVTKSATCLAEGVCTYTAKVTIMGKEYTDTKTEVIAATGHSYSETPTWSWSGYTAAVASFGCTEGDNNVNVDGVITSEIITAPTCESAGSRKYTAKVTYNNKEYTDVVTEELAALGHKYGEIQWTWVEDGKTASAKIVCSNDGSHILSANAAITSAVNTPATCAAKGTTTYTAKVTLNGQEYLDTKDVEDIATIVHTLVCSDNGDGTHTTACEKCDYTETENHAFVDGVCSICGSKENNDTDPSRYDDVIYLIKKNVCIGNATVLSLNMKNTTIAATGFEVEVKLPEGFSVPSEVDKYGDSRMKISLSTERTNSSRTNNFMTSILPNGNVKILCYSSNGYAFAGSDGEIAEITIALDDNVIEGDYPIELLGCVISNASKTLYLPNATTTFTAVSYTLGDANGDNFINVGDLTAIASHILGVTPENFIMGAADANVDNFINVGDLTFIANMILTGNVSHAKSMVAAKESFAEFAVSESTINEEGIINVPVGFHNYGTFSGFQFDINIPDGYKLKNISLCNNASCDFFNYSNVGNGTYRVLAYSLSNSNIISDENMLSILLEKTTNIPATCEVVLENGFVSNAYETLALESTKVSTANYEVTSIEKPLSNSNRIEVFDLTGKSVMSTTNASEINKLNKGVYIINGLKYYNK